jgi:putative transposase
MSYPLVRDLAAEGIPVRLTCGVLGHSRQAYYAWLADPISARELEDAHLTNVLIDAHGDDPEFGYRFLADELERAGHHVGERRVWRLCSQQRLWSVTVRKGRRGAGKSPGPAVHDDHVRRNFTAAEPDQVWVTDITEHPTAEGKLYCCAIKDLFSNRIVGYALDERMTAQLAVTALRTAVARRQPAGVVVVHSDRGSQGGLNRSSQHPRDHGGVQWLETRNWRRCPTGRGGSGRRIGRCVRRCGPRDGPNRRVRCNGSSGG